MAEVPPGVVTVMSTVPASLDGEVATQVVALAQDTAVPGVVPNMTVVVAEPATKVVPVMVTTVAPVIGPDEGARPVTVGTAR